MNSMQLKDKLRNISKEKNESLINESNQLQNEIKENPLAFINILKEFIKII